MSFARKPTWEHVMRQEQLKGHLDGLILAVLAEKALHGYAVMEALKERSHGALAIEGGTLYPALHRLEDAGLISGSWSVILGRRRRTYALTARGRKELAAQRTAWGEFVRIMGGILSPDLASEGAP